MKPELTLVTDTGSQLEVEAFGPPPQQGEMPFAMVEGEPVTELPKDLYIPPDALQVFLEAFEGPLDLLLYLIRRQNLDVLDIPIAEITRQYMKYIDVMQELQLELAGEYLLMAAMLAEIKSRMLLPQLKKAGEEEEDPRAELVRRLQEYERFKKAAEDIDRLPRMERDTMAASAEIIERKAVRVVAQVTLQEMLLAFKDVLSRADMFAHHHIRREQLSVRQRMSEILSRLREAAFIEFVRLFDPAEGRMGVTVTFIAMLELMKEGLLEIVQAQPYAPIHVRPAGGKRHLSVVGDAELQLTTADADAENAAALAQPAHPDENDEPDDDIPAVALTTPSSVESDSTTAIEPEQEVASLNAAAEPAATLVQPADATEGYGVDHVVDPAASVSPQSDLEHGPSAPSLIEAEQESLESTAALEAAVAQVAALAEPADLTQGYEFDDVADPAASITPQADLERDFTAAGVIEEEQERLELAATLEVDDEQVAARSELADPAQGYELDEVTDPAASTSPQSELEQDFSATSVVEAEQESLESAATLEADAEHAAALAQPADGIQGYRFDDVADPAAITSLQSQLEHDSSAPSVIEPEQESLDSDADAQHAAALTEPAELTQDDERDDVADPAASTSPQSEFFSATSLIEAEQERMGTAAALVADAGQVASLAQPADAIQGYELDDVTDPAASIPPQSDLDHDFTPTGPSESEPPRFESSATLDADAEQVAALTEPADPAQGFELADPAGNASPQVQLEHAFAATSVIEPEQESLEPAATLEVDFEQTAALSEAADPAQAHELDDLADPGASTSSQSQLEHNFSAMRVIEPEQESLEPATTLEVDAEQVAALTEPADPAQDYELDNVADPAAITLPPSELEHDCFAPSAIESELQGLESAATLEAEAAPGAALTQPAEATQGYELDDVADPLAISPPRASFDHDFPATSPIESEQQSLESATALDALAEHAAALAEPAYRGEDRVERAYEVDVAAFIPPLASFEHDSDDYDD